jgi:hypothetical protein
VSASDSETPNIPGFLWSGGRDGRLNIGSLATIMAGIISSAFGEGVAQLIGQLFQSLLIAPLNGLASFLGTLVDDVVGVPAAANRGIWAEATSFLAELGPLALPVAVLFVVVVIWILGQWGDLSG